MIVGVILKLKDVGIIHKLCQKRKSPSSSPFANASAGLRWGTLRNLFYNHLFIKRGCATS